MAKLISCLILFVFINSNSIAQIGNVIGSRSRIVSIKKHNNETPRNTTISLEKTLQKIAKDITKNCATDTEKVHAIFKYITVNFQYDNELHHSKKLQKEFYTSEENVLMNVLKRKKALCGGFAFLFKSLCKTAGIEAEVIHGFTKNYNIKNSDPKNPNHTWNAVKINGGWQLLDITWAKSYHENGTSESFWYFTEPSDFIKTHYPEDKKWALLGNIPSYNSFQKGAIK